MSYQDPNYPTATESELYPHPCDVCGRPASLREKNCMEYVCHRANCQAIYTMTFKANCDTEPQFEEVPIN